jgi:DNA-binding MarR family transcriptional regulator
MIPSEQAEGTPMNDQQPQPPESDADVVLSALKNMGSSDYATLAIATGLSKPAISSAITELSKQGLVTGKSGTYSPTDAAAKKPTNAKAATAEEPPPPPPPPPAEAKKPKPAAKPATTDSGADSDMVLAALKKMGSGTYATLAEATGLSKPAVSSAITDLSKQGLVTGKAGEYTITGATPKTAAAKAPQQDSTPTPAPQSAASLANELEKLAALRDSGALTAAEFTKAKKKLLDTD